MHTYTNTNTNTNTKASKNTNTNSGNFCLETAWGHHRYTRMPESPNYTATLRHSSKLDSGTINTILAFPPVNARPSLLSWGRIWIPFDWSQISVYLFKFTWICHLFIYISRNIGPRAHHEHKVNGFRQMGINLDLPASIIFPAQSNIPSTTENWHDDR